MSYYDWRRLERGKLYNIHPLRMNKYSDNGEPLLDPELYPLVKNKHHNFVFDYYFRISGDHYGIFLGQESVTLPYPIYRKSSTDELNGILYKFLIKNKFFFFFKGEISSLHIAQSFFEHTDITEI